MIGSAEVCKPAEEVHTLRYGKVSNQARDGNSPKRRHVLMISADGDGLQCGLHERLNRKAALPWRAVALNALKSPVTD